MKKIYTIPLTVIGNKFLARFNVDLVADIEPVPSNIKICNYMHEHLYAFEQSLAKREWDRIYVECHDYILDNFSEIYDG